MAKPGKRWQLLLVADDGHIIPFRRVKGFVLTLMILVVLLGVGCALLAWRLVVENNGHRQARERLAEAHRRVAHHQGERERLAAELVLTQSRLSKWEPPVSPPPETVSQPAAPKPAEGAVASAVRSDPAVQPSGPGPPPEPTPAPQSEPAPASESQPASETAAANDTSIPKSESGRSKTPRVADDRAAADPGTTPVETPAEPLQPKVGVSKLRVKHDAAKRTLVARFRIRNNGPRSSPVAGRCVVVLKDEGDDPGTWLTMPSVELVDGRPNGRQGWTFRISRFIDLNLKAEGQTDPSIFKTAVVFVFDRAGVEMLQEVFPVDLPAPKPAPDPAAVSETPRASASPVDDRSPAAQVLSSNRETTRSRY